MNAGLKEKRNKGVIDSNETRARGAETEMSELHFRCQISSHSDGKYWTYLFEFRDIHIDCIQSLMPCIT